MDTFAAIVLVCLSTVEIAACTQENALDVRSVEVANEMSCLYGWQEVIARTPRAEDVGKDTYVKTLCERIKGRDKAAKPPPGEPTRQPG